MQSKTNELFSLLDKWRNFPAYQLERRADIFFALYLKTIIKDALGETVVHIIPEFPIRKGELNDKYSNKSFKIDYLATTEKGKVLLIELKTDITSKRGSQDEYLEQAKEKNIKILIDGLLKIFSATKSKNKYLTLLNEVQKVGWLNYDKEANSWVNTSQNQEIEIVYIQPTIKEVGKAKVISFDDVSKAILKIPNDNFAKRFAKSLKEWKVNPNENKNDA